MVMDVARTSMIHAAAPHFLWSFAVQYAAHQINLQPHVSLPETTPTLRWTGKVGEVSGNLELLSAILQQTSCPPVPFPASSLASPLTHLGGSSTTPPRVVFCPLRTSRLTSVGVRGVGVRVVGTVVDSAVDGAGRAVPDKLCVDSPVLGLLPPPDGLLMDHDPSHHPPPWVAVLPPHLASCSVLSGHPLPPQGPAPSGVSQIDPAEPVEVAVDSGAARGAEPAGAGNGGAEPGGAEPCYVMLSFAFTSVCLPSYVRVLHAWCERV
ncbi:unnamed protein product [Closterium sp. NIES-54]